MEQKNDKMKVYNVIIMDRSGSMWDIHRPAIQGYNEVLGTIKANAKKYAETQEHFITLVLFDSTSVDNVYWNEDPEKAQILTSETYVPGACTPLYDAMGKTMTCLEKELHGDENHSVVVTIITDGLENDSHEYNLAAIKGLIEHLSAEGWSFAYMGTDHDVEGVTVSLSVSNVIKFEKTEQETRASFLSESRARGRFFDKLNSFTQSRPMSSWEEKKRFSSRIAAEYYDESASAPSPEGRVTPAFVTSLQPNEIFVFGSNSDGEHTGGAAYVALKKFGAQMGQPFGLQGQSFAIPTVGPGIGPEEIGAGFHELVSFALAHPELTFLVTALGCDNAGLDPAAVSQYLEEGIPVKNIHFPKLFWKEFEKRGLV